MADDKAEAIFRFTNTGDAPVTIKDPRSSCGCTVPKLEKNEYQPGESGELKAIFTFGSRLGKQSKAIIVKAAGPNPEEHRLVMTTHIPKWLDIQPRILRWKVSDPGSTREIRVTVAEPERVEIQIPEATFKHFDVESSQVGPGEYIFKVTPKTIAQGITEFVRFNASINEKEVTRSRPFGVHCLIR